jgi:hypothetical protein
MPEQALGVAWQPRKTRSKSLCNKAVYGYLCYLAERLSQFLLQHRGYAKLIYLQSAK